MNDTLPILNLNFNAKDTTFGASDTAKSVQSFNTIGFNYNNMGSLFSFSGVPSYSYPQTRSLDQIDALLKKGYISEDEAIDSIRVMNGYAPIKKETENKALEDIKASVSPFRGADLENAKTSNKGAYEVNEAQTIMAENAVEKIKEILKKDPSTVSEAEAEEIKECFSVLKQNPMIADAFITKANTTSFKGKNSTATTLLGSYQQVLTKLHGKKDAEETITEIKDDLETTVGQRNSTEFNTFNTKYDSDKKNVKYSFGDKLKRHPLEIATITGTGLTAGIFGLVKSHGFRSFAKGAGVWGGVALATAAIGYSAYKLATD